MDLKINKQKVENVQKVLHSEAQAPQDVELDDDLRVVPLTREMLKEQIEEALESVRLGKKYSTEEVLAYLASEDV
jgi:hypothetical protein